MKDLLEFIIKALVDDPAEVKIEEAVNEKNVKFKLFVAKSDIGQVIGKKGRTANSIRTILSAVSAKQGKVAEFQIFDDEKD